MDVQNAFIGQAAKPTGPQLSAALGPAKALWDRLIEELETSGDIDGQEWNSYSRKAGWSLRLKRGQRNIVYLSPCRGAFRASFALGEKALAAARASGLPEAVLKVVAQAKKYAEGTAVRIDVAAQDDIAVVKKLAAAKLKY